MYMNFNHFVQFLKKNHLNFFSHLNLYMILNGTNAHLILIYIYLLYIYIKEMNNYVNKKKMHTNLFSKYKYLK